MSTIHSLSIINKAGTPHKPAASAAGQSTGAGKSFSRILEQISTNLTSPRLNFNISNTNKLTPVRLLKYQMLVGEFHLRVELLSKVAESAAATIRKFQGGQT
ncbi:MAG: hypothetical protein D6719_11050 [Candidatus Dadabacteria bacterium]|nr:MAG: hypothetical protein D6719_11050 [Candidatus Dadabacteria bacterium]